LPCRVPPVCTLGAAAMPPPTSAARRRTGKRTRPAVTPPPPARRNRGARPAAANRTSLGLPHRTPPAPAISGSLTRQKGLKTEQIWTSIRGWTQSKILVRRTTRRLRGGRLGTTARASASSGLPLVFGGLPGWPWTIDQESGKGSKKKVGAHDAPMVHGAE